MNNIKEDILETDILSELKSINGLSQEELDLKILETRKKICSDIKDILEKRREVDSYSFEEKQEYLLKIVKVLNEMITSGIKFQHNIVYKTFLSVFESLSDDEKDDFNEFIRTETGDIGIDYKRYELVLGIYENIRSDGKKHYLNQYVKEYKELRKLDKREFKFILSFAKTLDEKNKVLKLFRDPFPNFTLREIRKEELSEKDLENISNLNTLLNKILKFEELYLENGIKKFYLLDYLKLFFIRYNKLDEIGKKEYETIYNIFYDIFLREKIHNSFEEYPDTFGEKIKKIFSYLDIDFLEKKDIEFILSNSTEDERNEILELLEEYPVENIYLPKYDVKNFETFENIEGVIPPEYFIEKFFGNTEIFFEEVLKEKKFRDNPFIKNFFYYYNKLDDDKKYRFVDSYDFFYQISLVEEIFDYIDNDSDMFEKTIKKILGSDIILGKEYFESKLNFILTIVKEEEKNKILNHPVILKLKKEEPQSFEEKTDSSESLEEKKSPSIYPSKEFEQIRDYLFYLFDKIKEGKNLESIEALKFKIGMQNLEKNEDEFLHFKQLFKEELRVFTQCYSISEIVKNLEGEIFLDRMRPLILECFKYGISREIITRDVFERLKDKSLIKKLDKVFEKII